MRTSRRHVIHPYTNATQPSTPLVFLGEQICPIRQAEGMTLNCAPTS